MKRVYIFILVFLMNIAAVWGQANGTQIAETDSTLIMQNSKVRIEFPKGKIFDISKFSLNGKELILNKGNNTIPWTLTYKGP